MRNIFGNQSVFGDNFYGRSEFIKQLVGILLSGNSFLLLGLRRIGKSSSIKQAIYLIRKQNKSAIIIDLNCQTYKSIEDFYKNLHLALPRPWQDQLREALKEGKRIPIKLIDFITDHIEELDTKYFGSIKLRNDALHYANPLKEEVTRFFAKQKEQIILIVDELPFLFESISKTQNGSTVLEIESILTVLRSWREIGIAQAICGSLNLHFQLAQLGISRKLLAGISTQVLPKFTHAEAHGLLTALSKEENVNLTGEDIEEMLSLIPDYIPQFLQYFFFIVKTHRDSKNAQISELYEKYVYLNIVKDFEYQFNERLAVFDKDEYSIVKQILDLVQKKESLHESAILKSVNTPDAYAILLKLLDQEFIVLDNRQYYEFSFNIVRQWWEKKNV